jgi:hypothetical protein
MRLRYWTIGVEIGGFCVAVIAMLACSSVQPVVFTPESSLLSSEREHYVRRAYAFPAISMTSLSLEGDWQFAVDPENVGQKQGFFKPEYDASEWRTIMAPAAWEHQGITQQNPALPREWMPYGGYAWYRRWIDMPMDWSAYDLEINLGRVDDREVCYFNGTKIGESKGLDDENRFLIRRTLVRYGKPNLVAVRVLDTGGEGGIVNWPLYLKPRLPWDAIELVLRAPDGTYTYFPEQPVAFEVAIRNPLHGRVQGLLDVRVTDYERTAVYEKTASVRVDASKIWSVLYSLYPLPRGHYTVEMRLTHGELEVKRSVSSFVVIGHPIAFQEVAASPFALCGGALFHIPLEQHPTLGATRLAQHARVGAYWGRNDLWWGIIEPEKGRFEWDKADSTVDLFRRYNVNLLGILCYFSAWSRDKAPQTDEQISEFAKYVFETVKRYKGQVHYWEVWNEPNLSLFWSPHPDPVVYAKLLKESYAAAKQAYPDVKIVGMVTSLVDLDFIRKVLEQGAGEAMDIISVHPYQGQPPTDFGKGTELGKLAPLKALLTQHRLGDIPIWITECGWQSLGDITERIQAEYVVKLYVKTLAQGLVERIYWFNLSDWGSPDSPAGGHFGLVHMDQSPKPSYAAYYTMVEQLHDFQHVQQMDCGTSGVSAYEFLFADGRRTDVMWSDDGDKDVRLPRGATSIIDIMGRERAVTSTSLRVGSSPLFLRCEKSMSSSSAGYTDQE